MVIVLYSLRGDKRMLEKLAKGTARFFVAQNIVEHTPMMATQLNTMLQMNGKAIRQ